MKKIFMFLLLAVCSVGLYAQTSIIGIGNAILEQNPTMQSVKEVLVDSGFTKDYEQFSEVVASAFRVQYYKGTSENPSLIAYIEKDDRNNVTVMFIFSIMGEYHKLLPNDLSSHSYEGIDTHIYEDGNSREDYSNGSKIKLYIYTFPEQEKIRLDMTRHYGVFD